MPTYQYACTTCGHQLEAVQSFTDDPLSECPECQGTLRKLFNSVGIVFKGSGFYRTDSRTEARSSGAKSGENGSAKSDSSSGSTSANGSGSSGSGTTGGSSDKGGSSSKQKTSTNSST